MIQLNINYDREQISNLSWGLDGENTAEEEEVFWSHSSTLT